MKYKLSVICPGIRPQNWLRLYESIDASFKFSWEIIFISPYSLPEELKDKLNITYIRSWRSPIACQQEGLTKVKGVFVTWAADDGYFLPNALTTAYEKLMTTNTESNETSFMEWLGITTSGIAFDHNILIMGKYYEGNNDGDMPMQSNEYYDLNMHDATRGKWIPKPCYMLNVGLVPTVLLNEVGGWDAENFEVCPMAYNDLAIRLQRKGVKFIIQDEMMFTCSHLPGHEGDHGPIHDGQILKDQPKFKNIYGTELCLKRIKIDINNWKQSEVQWSRRFGKTTLNDPSNRRLKQ